MANMKSAAEYCALAQKFEQDAARYPDDRGELLLEAADKWERAGQIEQAVAVLREVLTLGGEDAGFARFSLADLYFTQGADAEAREQLRVLEEMPPESTGPGPAELTAEMLEERGEYEAALHWYDRAIETRNLHEVVKPGGGPSLAAMPLRGRQRCRIELGLPPDELDRLADIDEQNRLEFAERLDRLAARKATRSEQPAEVRMLVWPRAELQLAEQRWPEVFAPDRLNHHAEIEQRLRELAEKQQSPRITLVLGSADGFADYLERTGGDPAEESVRLAYADEAGEQGRTAGWPPERNQACWCGSGRKYKKCCGSPAAAR